MDEWWKPLATLIGQKRFWAAVLLSVVTVFYFHIYPLPIDVAGFEWIFMIGIFAFWMLVSMSLAQALDTFTSRRDAHQKTSATSNARREAQRSVLASLPALNREQAISIKFLKAKGIQRFQGAKDHQVLSTLASLGLVREVASIDYLTGMFEIPPFVWDAITITQSEAEEFAQIDNPTMDDLFTLARRI